jgi:hypothetical protein
MSLLSFRRRDAVRGGIAGTEAVASRAAAQVLFEAGGRKILPAALQRALHGLLERETSRLVAGATMLEAGGHAPSAAAAVVRAAEGMAVRTVVVQTARAASRHVLRRVGAAAGAGALIDGGWALVYAGGRLKRGLMTPREAAVHVAREASTGAAATAAGTAAAVTVVALTGGVGAPAVFLVGAAAAIATKAGLDAWLSARARGVIRAELDSTSV